MISTSEIVKNYIYKLANGEKVSELEDYVEEIFKGKTKAELKQYCDEQGLFYRNRPSREMLFQSIYGSCNTQMSYRILMTSDIIGESTADYYKRIYAKDFSNKDVKKYDNTRVKEEPKLYLEYIKNSNNKYPEETMKRLRMTEGLDKYDFSRDKEINEFSANESFEKIMEWNDMYEELDVIKGCIKDIYKVDLDSIR